MITKNREKLAALVESVFEDVKKNDVGNAVITCARIARITKDYYSFAFFVFLQEAGRGEGARTVINEMAHLDKEFIESVKDSAFERSIKVFQIQDYEASAMKAKKDTILYYRSNNINNEIENLAAGIRALTVPQGIGEFDTAVFYKENEFPILQLRMKKGILERIRAAICTSCSYYASEIEQLIDIEDTATDFMNSLLERVNSFLREHSPKAVPMLSASFEYLSKNDQASISSALLQIRRFLKEIADALMPASTQQGLTEDKYLNRLSFFVEESLGKKAKPFTLEAEAMEKLLHHANEQASKGVYSEVSQIEARRVLFLALFLLEQIADAYSSTSPATTSV